MGESTAMKCVKMFIKEMTKSLFRTKYFSAMTAADAKRVEAYHKEVHGVHGMIGSVDGSHFVWEIAQLRTMVSFKEGRVNQLWL